jgi:oxalate decarboxylase
MADINRRKLLSAAAVAAVGAAAAGAGRAGNDEEIPTFRYALEESEPGHTTEGGSAREATVKQLPISKGIAGVSMRLKPGGLRELHWHANAAEWAFVVKGRVRTTVIGPAGVSETNDFGPGDVWYFPRGHGHALQGMGPEEAHFVLVFDNGAFSEFGTFSSTDWLGHTPPEVLSKALGISSADVAKFPKKELYIVQGRVPPERIEPLRQGGLNSSSLTHKYELMAQRPHGTYPGGEERLVSAKEFPISTTITGAILDLKPGGLREPHWHPNTNEWQYYISGQARMTLFGSHGRARTEQFKAGDVAYVPQGFGHYVENTGTGPCRVLVAFDSGSYQEISLSTWLASNPARLVGDNFKIPDSLVAKLPDYRVFLAGKDGPGRRVSNVGEAKP